MTFMPKKLRNLKSALVFLLMLLIWTVQVNSATSSGSTTISVRFVGNGVLMGAAEVAGVVAKGNWNNASGSVMNSPMALIDETGSASGVSIVWQADNLHSLPIPDQPGNVRMMTGYLDTHNGDATKVTVSGLAANSVGYNVYVYIDGDNGSATRSATYQISGAGITTTSIVATDPANTNFSGTFTRANNSSGNYVVFAVTGTGFTLTAIPGVASDGVQRAPLNGIQIVPAGQVSNPDFTLSSAPSSTTVSSGSSTTSTVSIGAVNGFSGSVNLSVSGLPTGVTASLSPAAVTPGVSSTLMVKTAANTPPGNTMLNITGASATSTHSVGLALTVNNAGAASGRTISIKFTGNGTTMGSTEVAGVVPQSNWNNEGWVSGTSTSLVDQTGMVSGATVSWKADGLHALPIADQAGNARMMRGYLDGSTDPTTVTVSGLPPNANGYSVYVYADGDNNTANRSAIFQISGSGITTTSVSLTDAANTNFSGTFTQANNSAGNYVVFGINATAFTISATASTASDGTQRAPLNAMQIVALASGGTGGSVGPSITTQPMSETVAVGQTATFSVAASGTGPLSYQWQRNGANINGATGATYATPLTTSADNGASFTVVVSNSAGSVTSNSATLTVTSDTTPPTVSITSPTSGTTVSGTVVVTASASDNTAVASVQFQADGTNIGAADTTSPYSFSLNTTTLSNGSHDLTAIATDTAGNQATSSVVVVTVSNTASTTTPGPLVVCTTNPRYFCDPSGNVVLLAGDGTWPDVIDEGDLQAPNTAAFDFNDYMGYLAAHKYNYARFWITNFSNDGGTTSPYTGPVWPWKRVGPGTANDGLLKTDFTQLDPNYFSRLRARVIQAGQNGLYVSVMLFDGYEYSSDVSSTDGNPYESTNNVNSVSCPNTCPINNTLIPSQVWTYQQTYIHTVIDNLHDLPNILYEVANEPPAGAGNISWINSVMAAIRNYESATYGVNHPVGIDFGNNVADSNVYDTAADFVGPSTKLPGDATGQCPGVTGNGGAINSSSERCKVVLNDSDHSYYYTLMQSDGAVGQQAWVWENFAHGNNVAFMDPYLTPWPGRNACTGAPVDGDSGLCATGATDSQWDPIRLAIEDILTFAKLIDLKDMTPQDALFGSGFGLASTVAPVSYFMFSPNGSTAETITTVAGTYTVEVFDTNTHAVISTTANVSVGSSYTFSPPGSDNYVVWIH